MRLTRRKQYRPDNGVFASERQRPVSTSALSQLPLDAPVGYAPPEVAPMRPGLRLAAWLAAAFVPWLAIAGLGWAGVLLIG